MVHVQGFTEDQDKEKEKDKDSQDHWWRVEFPEMAVWPSGEEDERKEKKEEKTPVSLQVQVQLYTLYRVRQNRY